MMDPQRQDGGSSAGRDDADGPPRPRGPAAAGLHALAVLAAALTWPLLLVGGTVTVYRVGMAVPDWPTTFGVNMFLYDFLNSSWGVFIEHGHRLYGAAVGMACVLLAAAATFASRGLAATLAASGAVLAAALVPALVPPVGAALGLGPMLGGLALGGAGALVAALVLATRPGGSLAALAWFVLACVIGQGVLGGYRVRLNSPDLAFLHGCTAQAFFALMIATCVVTGRGWSDGPLAADPAHLRRRSGVLLVLVYAQIVLGAWVRHDGDWRIVVLHAVMATAVWGHAVALAVRILKSRSSSTAPLIASARALLGVSTLQMAVGVLSWWLLRPFDGIARTVWPAQALVRIAHQGLGALLLAAAVVLTMRACRGLTSGPRPGPDRLHVPRPELEAVA